MSLFGVQNLHFFEICFSCCLFSHQCLHLCLFLVPVLLWFSVCANLFDTVDISWFLSYRCCCNTLVVVLQIKCCSSLVLSANFLSVVDFSKQPCKASSHLVSLKMEDLCNSICLFYWIFCDSSLSCFARNKSPLLWIVFLASNILWISSTLCRLFWCWFQLFFLYVNLGLQSPLLSWTFVEFFIFCSILLHIWVSYFP